MHVESAADPRANASVKFDFKRGFGRFQGLGNVKSGYDRDHPTIHRDQGPTSRGYGSGVEQNLTES
jgi:hypothetical protein